MKTDLFSPAERQAIYLKALQQAVVEQSAQKTLYLLRAAA